jgi:hypothetical protein
LILTGVPVPRDESWTRASRIDEEQGIWAAARQSFFYSSHLVNNMRIRNKLYCERRQLAATEDNTQRQKLSSGIRLTAGILKELKNEVTRRGSRLLVVFIPSKLEIDKIDNSVPYQAAFADQCEKLDLQCVDLAPEFKKVLLRTYYRQGMHWNARGHKVAAEALYEYLEKELVPVD